MGHPLTAPPPLELPSAIRARFDAWRPGFASELQERLRTLPRRCVYFDSVRTSDAPLRRSAVARWLGAKTASPALPATASKFGGEPYAEQPEDWSRRRFLGQIDLAEATAEIAGVSFRGLLRLDLPAHFDFVAHPVGVTWFPDASPARAVKQDGVTSAGRWETRLQFRLGWSRPTSERDWFSLLPGELEDLRDVWNEWEPRGFNEDDRDACHRMFGWPSGALDEHYGFTPPPGCSANVEDHEMLLRLTFDNEAGFSWGTNWIYLLVPREDFRRGDLSRVVATGANA